VKVCDRHPRKKATDTIVLTSTDSRFDLCESCTIEIAKFISDVKKDSVEKKRGLFGKKNPA